LPAHLRRRVLIRSDSGGGTHEFLAWLTRPGRRLAYSAGFTMTDDVAGAILKIPAGAWTPAYDADGLVRPGAWVAELTGMLDLDGWPKGMRIIVRKERPHPGAQLRFTGIDGHRFTFATSTKGGQLADLELRHRRRARCEDRIRCAQDTGLRNLPSTAMPRTRSGAKSWRWPASCSPGCRCSPYRPRPPMGTQTAPAADLHLRWAHRPRRSAPPAPPRRQLAMDLRNQRRDHPAPRPCTRLTSSNQPNDQKGHPRAVEPRPPGATAGPPR
jgi:hypothetical protein